VEADRPLDPKAPFAGSRADAKMRAKFSPKAENAAASLANEHAPAH
jgi:hypothetical protein